MDTSTEPPTRVALKKIKLIKQEGNAPNGLDISAIREMKALRHLSANKCHPNIAPLLDVWLPPSTTSVGNLHFVLPFYDFDLEAIIKDTQIVLSPADIKSWMWMMLSGIEYCHERDIIHRVKEIMWSALIVLGFKTG
jgi:cyclin-dependent kinase 7